MKFRVEKKGIYVLIVIAAVVAGFFGWQYASKNDLFERAAGGPAQKIEGVTMPTITTQNEPAPTGRPVNTPAQVRAEGVTQWRHLGIPWNGQIGLIYANGGPTTARSSLMNQAGINLRIERQDDYAVLATELVRFAQAYKNGDRDPTVGANSVTIMGDGAPGFLAGLQPQLDRLGLHARIIGAFGRSYGEDKCMGPPEWLDDPSKAKGGVIAGVLRDGDIHICMMWAQANGIPVNPDPTTYDASALNFFATSSFTEADQAYITGKCEQRPVVVNGMRTGENRRVCVQGTATWTPGDVNVLRNKGGVVSLLSTRETASQMFAVVIVIDEWARENERTTINFLKAALDGSATVARDRTALRQAAGFSVGVWKEQDAAYWERYYTGRVEDDPVSGRQVRLGGSQALGLASNLEYFIPGPDGRSVFDRVYTTFGDLDSRLYPDVMPSYPRNVVNTSFLVKIRDAVGNVGRGDVFNTFTGSESQVVARRPYSIQFEVGSATILSSSTPMLEDILNNITTGSGLAIKVDGYTSSDGDPAFNRRLSEARAEAVRQWLIARAPAGLITPERIRVEGHGPDSPVADNGTEAGRRANRRVEIQLLSEGL